MHISVLCNSDCIEMKHMNWEQGNGIAVNRTSRHKCRADGPRNLLHRPWFEVWYDNRQPFGVPERSHTHCMCKQESNSFRVWKSHLLEEASDRNQNLC